MLLLTFFVMLVSYASFDPSKAREIVLSLRGALGISTQPTFQSSLNRRVPSNITRRRIAGVQTEISQQIRHRGLLGRLQVSITERGLTISLLEPVLFPAGSARLQPEAYQLLDALAEILAGYVNDIIIEGHADSHQVPAGGKEYDAWGLSAARARAVLDYFIDQNGLTPSRLTFSGCGAQRPYPPGLRGLSERERRTFNNRVEIQIVASDSTSPCSENVTHQILIPTKDSI